jgi:hypothetical protein
MARDFLPHRSLLILFTKSALKSWITTTVHIGSVFLGHDSCNRRFLVSLDSCRLSDSWLVVQFSILDDGAIGRSKFIAGCLLGLYDSHPCCCQISENKQGRILAWEHFGAQMIHVRNRNCCARMKTGAVHSLLLLIFIHAEWNFIASDIYTCGVKGVGVGTGHD